MADSEFSQEAGPNAEQYGSLGDQYIDKRKFNFNSLQTAEESYKDYLQLVDQFEADLENRDEKFEEIYEGLQHWVSRDIQNPKSLRQKLEEAGFSENYYNRVNSLKEKYSMEMVENDLAFSAKKIHAFLLADVAYRFLTHVNPFIDDGIDKITLQKIINQEVIEPIYNIVSQNNVLNISKYDLMCMVYYLTGNCHINWI